MTRRDPVTGWREGGAVARVSTGTSHPLDGLGELCALRLAWSRGGRVRAALPSMAGPRALRRADILLKHVGGTKPDRGEPEAPAEALPADLVHLRLTRVRLSGAEVAVMSKDQAIARMQQYWRPWPIAARATGHGG